MKKAIIKLAVFLFLIVGVASISMPVSADVSQPPQKNVTYDVYIPSWEPVCDGDCKTQCELSKNSCSNECDGTPAENACKQGCEVEYKGCVKGCGC